MIAFRSLQKRIAKWRADESGSVAVETILMVPLLAWAMLSTLSFFDAYRTEAISTRASLTIADMFSRETDYINNTYMDGARNLLQFLTLADDAPDLRVTVIRWDEDEDRHRRVWSRQRGGVGWLSQSQVANLADRLPEMTDDEVIILVQTFTDYEPIYGVGIDPYRISTFTVISPRFVNGQFCWNNTGEEEDSICT